MKLVSRNGKPRVGAAIRNALRPLAPGVDALVMLPIKPSPIRNKINFSNVNELRVLKKRLGVSVDDLRRIVAKVGNSISTVSKEVELEKANGANSQPPSPQTKLFVVVGRWSSHDEADAPTMHQR